MQGFDENSVSKIKFYGTQGHKERGEAPTKCSASRRCSPKAMIYFSDTLFPVTSYISPF